MKVVIDIPEEEYKCVQITGHIGNATQVSNAILNGTPLPKGHGRLIDADALVSKAYEEAQGMTNNNFGVEVEWLVDKTPAIIEADKEAEE